LISNQFRGEWGKTNAKKCAARVSWRKRPEWKLPQIEETARGGGLKNSRRSRTAEKRKTKRLRGPREKTGEEGAAQCEIGCSLQDNGQKRAGKKMKEARM